MRLEQVPYVVVQAGGKGTRLGHHTHNKPKCLVSVDGESLLYRLFRQFPKAEFLVIGDHQVEALAAFLETVTPPVPHRLIRTQHTGTVAGIRDAVDFIAEGSPFLIVWSDLLFDEPPSLELGASPVVALMPDGWCRWSVTPAGQLAETPSKTSGVAGAFYFPDTRHLPALPPDGEFVRLLHDEQVKFKAVPIPGLREIGTTAALDEVIARSGHARYFNDVQVRQDDVVKVARDKNFEGLLRAEADWYEKVSSLGFGHVPEMLERSPLRLRRVHGQHPFAMNCGTSAQRSRILEAIIECLAKLHSLESAPADPDSTAAMYFDKPLRRVNRVRPLIPHIDEPTIRVDGMVCRNPFHSRYEAWFADIVAAIDTRRFQLIHGDPTLSNILIDDNRKVWLIDPRGVFADTRYVGDPNYDWAKLLYSIEGNYDQFNRGNFRISLTDTSVKLEIGSNGWEAEGAIIREHLGGAVGSVDVLHALIWFSLCEWVLNDYDAVLAAFYKGVHTLERATT